MKASLPAALRWRLLQTPVADGATNMALDHSLARLAAATGEAIVRVYGWQPATVSFGRNQRARGAYDPARLAARGLGVVRRPTGGRSILHDRELTYAVALPLAAATAARSSYDAVTTLLLDALRRLGVDAERAEPRTRSRAPGPAPCFAEPAAGEVSWRGAKLAGSAQWVEGEAALQHGSVLIDDDQHALAGLGLEPLEAVPAPATLRAALGRAPELAEFAAAWRDALESATGVRPVLFDPEAPEAQPQPPLLRLYHDDEWTWRR